MLEVFINQDLKKEGVYDLYRHTMLTYLKDVMSSTEKAKYRNKTIVILYIKEMKGFYHILIVNT